DPGDLGQHPAARLVGVAVAGPALAFGGAGDADPVFDEAVAVAVADPAEIDAGLARPAGMGAAGAVQVVDEDIEITVVEFDRPAIDFGEACGAAMGLEIGDRAVCHGAGLFRGLPGLSRQQGGPGCRDAGYGQPGCKDARLPSTSHVCLPI